MSSLLFFVFLILTKTNLCKQRPTLLQELVKAELELDNFLLLSFWTSLPPQVKIKLVPLFWWAPHYILVTELHSSAVINQKFDLLVPVNVESFRTVWGLSVDINFLQNLGHYPIASRNSTRIFVQLRVDHSSMEFVPELLTSGILDFNRFPRNNHIYSKRRGSEILKSSQKN